MSHRELVAMHHCQAGVVKSCLHRAAIHRGVSYSLMLYLAWRESRYQPGATNSQSGAAGLLQFLPSTWAGSWNPYRARSPYSAKWNALAGALALSRGYASWWSADY